MNSLKDTLKPEVREFKTCILGLRPQVPPLKFGRPDSLVAMNEAFVPTVVSLSAVLLSATVGLVLRYRCSAKPAPGATLLKEEATPAAPGAAELKETMVSLAEEGACWFLAYFL